MAYREIEMWEVLEILRRIGRGEEQRAIGRATGMGYHGCAESTWMQPI